MGESGDFLASCMQMTWFYVIWREKERSRVRAAQMDNLRGLLGIRRMDRVPNARIRE